MKDLNKEKDNLFNQMSDELLEKARKLKENYDSANTYIDNFDDDYDELDDDCDELDDDCDELDDDYDELDDDFDTEYYAGRAERSDMLGGISYTDPVELVDYVDQCFNDISFYDFKQDIIDIRDKISQYIDFLYDAPHVFPKKLDHFSQAKEKFLYEKIFGFIFEYLNYKIEFLDRNEHPKIDSLNSFSKRNEIERRGIIRKKVQKNLETTKKVKLFMDTVKQIFICFYERYRAGGWCYTSILAKMKEKDLDIPNEVYETIEESEICDYEFFSQALQYAKTSVLLTTRMIKERFDLMIDILDGTQTSLVPEISVKSFKKTTEKFIEYIMSKDERFDQKKERKEVINEFNIPLVLMCDTSIRFISLPFLKKYRETLEEKYCIKKGEYSRAYLKPRYITSYRTNLAFKGYNDILMIDQFEKESNKVFSEFMSIHSGMGIEEIDNKYFNCTLTEIELSDHLKKLEVMNNFLLQNDIEGELSEVNESWESIKDEYEKRLKTSKYILTQFKQAKKYLLNTGNDVFIIDRVVHSGATVFNTINILANVANEMRKDIRFHFMVYGTTLEKNFRDFFGGIRKSFFGGGDLKEFPFEVNLIYPKKEEYKPERNDLGMVFAGGKLTYMRVKKSEEGIESEYGIPDTGRNISFDEERLVLSKDNLEIGALKDRKQCVKLQRFTVRAIERIMGL